MFVSERLEFDARRQAIAPFVRFKAAEQSVRNEFRSARYLSGRATAEKRKYDKIFKVINRTERLFFIAELEGKLLNSLDKRFERFYRVAKFKSFICSFTETTCGANCPRFDRTVKT